jgi:hypothetical protein
MEQIPWQDKCSTVIGVNDQMPEAELTATTTSNGKTTSKRGGGHVLGFLALNGRFKRP